MIKIGDKIKIIKLLDEYHNAKLGDILTVIEVRKTNSIYDREYKCSVDRNGKEYNLYIIDAGVIWIKITKEETNEELLNKINEGIESREQLAKRITIEYKVNHGSKIWIEYDLINFAMAEFRIKPKKEFKSFITSNGYCVNLYPDNILAIDCFKIELKEAKNILDCFINMSATSYVGKSDIFNACKYGISLQGSSNNKISWEDAEKVLKAIEDYTND